MNSHIDHVVDLITKIYKYPHILTHEALFKQRISMRYVTAILCHPNYEKRIKKYLHRYGFDRISIFVV